MDRADRNSLTALSCVGLAKAIREVNKGNTYFSPSIAKRIQEVGAPDYRPRIHLDLYGTLGDLFGDNLEALADYLARAELAIALEEWHRLIPEYEVANTEGLMESGPQIGIDKLHLRWA